MDKEPEFSQQKKQQQFDERERSSTKRRTRPSSDADVAKTTDAFS
jgi:hypothetical protein